MGRRRTLINDFGANWTTGRVSVKKRKKKMANEHDNNSNHYYSILSILCYEFTLITNIVIIRIELLYHIISYIVFRFFFYSIHCFSCFHISFFFLYFLSFFRSSLIFFFFRRVSSVMFSDSLQTWWQIKKVWCGVSDVIAVKSNFASLSTRKKYGLAGLHFCSRFWKFIRRNALEISMIVRDRSDNASASYVTSCCF